MAAAALAKDDPAVRVRTVEACAEGGLGLAEAALRLGLSVNGLRAWLCQNAPDLYERVARSYRKKEDWPDGALTLLTRLHSAGTSAAETARQINAIYDLGVTKPTVQFRAESLGLGGFGQASPRPVKILPPAVAPAADCPWPPERVARLIALEKQGLSRAQIAAALSDETRELITRNAVISKLARLFPERKGKPARRPANRPVAKPKRRAALPAAAPGKPGGPPAPVIAEAARVRLPAPDPLNLRFLELASGLCHWPVSLDAGDALTRPVHAERFCGHASDGRYCAAHRPRVSAPGPAPRVSEADLARAETAARRAGRARSQRIFNGDAG